MYAEVAWVLVSSGTQVQPQIMPDPDYLPHCLSVSYDYELTNGYMLQGTSLLWMFAESSMIYGMDKE